MLSNRPKTESIVTATIRHCAALLILLCSLPVLVQGAEPDYALIVGTYSNLKYNSEGGDLIGVEVHIVPGHQGVKAIVQFASGDVGDPVVVDVVATGTHVHFEMPAGFKIQGTFDGTVSSQGLEGTFSNSRGVQKHLVLPRTRSYWETKS